MKVNFKTSKFIFQVQAEVYNVSNLSPSDEEAFLQAIDDVSREE